MMKRTLIATVAALMVSGAAFAASVPVTDIHEGQSRVGAEYSFAQSATDQSGHSDGFGVSLSTGLSDKLALQYAYGSNNLKEGDIKDHRVDAVYNIAPNFNLYGGATFVKAPDDTETGFQAGVIGYMPLTDKIQGFAKVGFGNDIKQTYQVGATYDFGDNLDLSLYYQYDKYSLDAAGDGNIKGFHAGLGYSF